jgi:hypothetical protein
MTEANNLSARTSPTSSVTKYSIIRSSIEQQIFG